MTLNDFYNEVSRRVDTGTMQINAAETKRVLSEAFKYLSSLDAAACADVFAKGLATAKKKK